MAGGQRPLDAVWSRRAARPGAGELGVGGVLIGFVSVPLPGEAGGGGTQSGVGPWVQMSEIRTGMPGDSVLWGEWWVTRCSTTVCLDMCFIKYVSEV